MNGGNRQLVSDEHVGFEKSPIEVQDFRETNESSIELEIRLHKQNTHTQRHMNNAWSEMVILAPCLAF